MTTMLLDKGQLVADLRHFDGHNAGELVLRLRPDAAQLLDAHPAGGKRLRRSGEPTDFLAQAQAQMGQDRNSVAVHQLAEELLAKAQAKILQRLAGHVEGLLSQLVELEHDRADITCSARQAVSA
jgi:hypothetical protein